MNSLIFRILNIPFYLVLFLLLKNSLSAAENNILIYAAASTNDIFIDLKEEFNSSKNLNIRISASSSSTLAKQIISGAPANIYISARCMKQIIDLAKGWAIVNGNEYVSHQDIKDTIPYILRHRIRFLNQDEKIEFVNKEILEKIDIN